MAADPGEHSAAPRPLAGRRRGTLRSAMKRDILIYCASAPLAHVFLRDWAALFGAPGALAVVVEDGAAGVAEACGWTAPGARIMSHSRLRDACIEGTESVVFYGVEDALRFEALVDDMQAKLGAVSFKTAVTTSPSVFCTYFFGTKAGHFECFIPEEAPDSFYRRLFSAADVIYHAEPRDTPQYHEITARAGRLSPEELEGEAAGVLRSIFHGPHDIRTIMSAMLNKNLFDSALLKNIIDVGFCSEKLVILHNIIRQKQDERIVIYVAGADDLRLLAHIVRGWTSPEKDRGGEAPVPDQRENTVLISGRTLIGGRTVLDITVTCLLPPGDGPPPGTSLVLFDFAPALYGCSTFILASRRQAEEFRELIRLDDRIENEVRGRLGRGAADVYRFKILSDSFDKVKAACSKKRFVHSIKKGTSHLFVTSSCGAGRIQTAINLHNATGEPVLFPALKRPPDGTREPASQHGLALAASKISLGTLTSLCTFAGPAPLPGQGYVSIGHRGLTVYSFSKGLNLRIEVRRDGIEGWVLLGVHHNKAAGTDCELFVPLKFRPKVFVHRNSSSLGKKLRDGSPVADKMAYFEKMEWARACSSDVPFFRERHDLRVAVPLVRTDGTSVLSDESSVLSSIARIVSGYSVRLVYTHVRGEAVDLSPSELVSAFEGCGFAAVYAVLSLVSRKGRLLVNRLGRPDLEHLRSVDVPGFCRSLDIMLRRRFERFSIADVRAAKSTQCNVVRTAVVTPLATVFGYESMPETNRVLRNFDRDKFIRFSLRDDGGGRFLSDGTVDQDGVHEYFRRVMLEGLAVGPRKYFFLAATTSQLKEHNAWFVTPHEQDGAIVGADYIKSWLGDFSDVKNIGKYTVRVGQALSTTTDAYEIHDFVEVADIVRNGYSFTDGVGLISEGHALAVSRILGLARVPSAFQIRFAGFKGVVAVQPLLDDRDAFGRWAARNGLRGGAAEDRPGRCGLVLRATMNKFPSRHRMLEIVAASKSTEFFLNRQIIMILEGFGIPARVFKDLQDRFVLEVLSAMDADFPSFVRRHVAFFPRNLISTEFLLFRKLVGPILRRVFDDLNRKSKIRVPQGRAAMGVSDELQVLEEDEIFLMYESTGCSGCTLYGSFAVPVGPAIVAKNPCMHPGDIRVVRCVDRKELHYLRDVVVFSQRGSRPLFNQCSGSDLDGDIFLVSWDPLLVPRVTFRPYNYTSDVALAKETVLLSDMINFYVRYLKSYQLGVIAHAFMAAADRESVFSPKALRLGELFNRNIDFIKTGNIASVPDDLIPAAYPDYMERLPAYRSERAIGELYRRSSVGGIVGACECSACTRHNLRQLHPWQAFLLRGSSIVVREETVSDEGVDDGGARTLFREYSLEMRHLINKHGLKTEESLFCARDPAALCELGDLLKRYGREVEGVSVAAIARLSTRCSEAVNSLAWLSPEAHRIRSRTCAYEEGTGPGFVFNTRISLVPHDSAPGPEAPAKRARNEDPGDFYDGEFRGKTVMVRADTERIGRFLGLLDAGIVGAFREVFNLVLISGLHKISEVDRVFDLLERVRQEMRSPTRLEISRILFSFSDNTLFRIGLVLPLDFSIVSKARMLREERKDRTSFERPVKIYRGLNLVISGMLDENDDVEFVASRNAQANKTMFVPVLKNRGTCGIDYYRDNVRDFLVNILFSNECVQFARRNEEAGAGGGSRVCYEMLFVPGTFYLSRLSRSLVHDRMSIRELQALISRNDPAINTWFVNGHASLDAPQSPGSSEDAGRAKRHSVFSFSFKETRYDLEYVGPELVKVARGRRFLGKEYIINSGGATEDARNDLMIELIRYEVVYGAGVDLLDEDEAFMLSRDLLAVSGASCVLSPLLSCCTSFRLEVNTPLRSEDCFHLVHRTVYGGSAPRLQGGEPRTCCFAGKSWFSDESFDRVFARLWKAYAKVLSK